MSVVPKERDDLVYRHFYSHGHHGLPDVSIQLIDKVRVKDDLLAKQGQWVYRLRSLKPDGLKESDFVFGDNRGERGRKLNFLLFLAEFIYSPFACSPLARAYIVLHVRMSLLFELLRLTLFTVKVVARAFLFQWRSRNFF